MPLVKLVQHDGGDAAQLRVGKQPARQHPLGQEPQPRARAGHFLEPHLVAHRLAHALAEFGRHPPRRQPRGQPPRLQHQHLAGQFPQQGRRHAGRLAGPRRRLEHQRALPP